MLVAAAVFLAQMWPDLMRYRRIRAM